MDTQSSGSKQRRLENLVAETIINSSRSLSRLQDDTGFHRSKLGRMRQGGHHITVDEAEIVLRACGKPVRALFILSLVHDDCEITSEGLAYLERFIEGLPMLIKQLNAIGSTLNPKWATGSIQCLANLITEHANRCIEADTFQVP